MEIAQMLKRNTHLHIPNGQRWLCWNPIWNEWTVYEMKSGSNTRTIVVSTESEEIAARALLDLDDLGTS